MNASTLFVGACLAGAAAMPLIAAEAHADQKKCLYISSYARGYEWSDQVESGLRSVLESHCDIRQFDMDTKRYKAEEEKVERARMAKAIIEEWQPDIVITADDNAAKYLIQPHFRDHALPFVFCGVNWTVEEYGFPYANVTGMIEVAPIVPMLEHAGDIAHGMRSAFYIGADTLTEQKNLDRFQDAAKELGIALEYQLVGTTEEWVEAYARAQQTDVVVMGSNAGIDDWDHDRALAGVLASTRRLSVTNHGWMMPYTIMGVTKVPEEQGEWAAEAALAILGGVKPSELPIVPNKRRDIWINATIVEASGIDMPENTVRKAKKVASLAVGEK